MHYTSSEAQTSAIQKTSYKIHTEHDTVWLVIGRELSNPEIEEFDLEYIGERMSYERVQSEIKRLSR